MVSARKGHPWDPRDFSLCLGASWKTAGNPGTAGLLEPWLSVQLCGTGTPLPLCKIWDWGCSPAGKPWLSTGSAGFPPLLLPLLLFVLFSSGLAGILALPVRLGWEGSKNHAPRWANQDQS